ncbi:probable cytochrome P450 6a13 [Neocloeon triangulifer]|uniref:probable cytochrome P450 6a13 n=1 Tax=Neocloeon triangulifer TaxID=2078957 RepID=UPI00286EDE8B|nr:probable cytochrome P450 6a13 [Neocloeon triangulifer]
MLSLGVQISLSLLGLIIYLGYKLATRNFDYWQKQGVKFLKPVPILGSISSLFMLREHPCQFAQRVYRENEGQPFVGYFQGTTQTLMAIDPEFIKQIFVKDFSHFVDHGFKISEEGDPLQALNLFNLEGQRWKDMRTKLVPTFTSGKIKAMFPLMQECNDQFDKYLDKLAESKEIFEAKDVLGRLFTDIIGSCIFGIKCNTIENPDNQFRKMGKRLIDVNIFQAIKLVFIIFLPEIALKLKLGVLENDVSEFFLKLTKDMVEKRKKEGIVRRDFLQLLMELKDKGSVAIDADDEDQHLNEETADHKTTSNIPFKFDDIDLAAQSTVFFLAGFETSSTVICFTLLELAMNPDVQRKAQIEVDECLAQNNGKISYDTLKDMKYLDWVLKESMRKYPPVALHSRLCTKKYVIPETNVVLEKGTIIGIPNHALQNDPKYFPDPDRFDPERFSDEDLLRKYQYIYTPFGEGPRQCIGNRFASIQSKLALFTFLRKYTVVACPKTVYPVNFDAKQFILTSKEGIWLRMEKRQ